MPPSEKYIVQKITDHLKKTPWYILLLPVFFVLHGYVEYFGFVSITDAAALAGRYILFSLLVFGFSWLVFRNVRKAAVVAGSWMGFYLFFGAVYDFLKAHAPHPFFWKYSFLLPLAALLLIILFGYTWMTGRKFYKLTFFLNILFLVYIPIDIVNGIFKSANPEKQRISFYRNLSQQQFVLPDTIRRPDIYFLVFDEYASSVSLKKRYDFNNDLDTFLLKKGFSIQEQSVSNYNYTPFFIASALNMNYLNWLDTARGLTRKMYLECNVAILQNSVLQILGMNGYEMINFSMFDLEGHPSSIRQSFLPVKSKMIAEGTFLPRFYRDFTWIFQSNKLLSKLLENDDVFQHVHNNEYFLSELNKLSGRLSDKPRFIYAHLYMPHNPFVYDERGNRQDVDTINSYSAPAYLRYVRYTNTRIRQMVNKLISDTKGEAVIVLMGDHGFRVPTTEKHPRWVFENMNAVYFPDKDYSKMYDHISGVNQFRAVFNSVFDTNFPMLPDSTIYLLSPPETIEHGR